MQLTAASCPTKDLLSAPDLASNALAIESPQAVHTGERNMNHQCKMLCYAGMQETGSLQMLTNASVEFHGNDRALVALVLPGAVPKLGHPAFGRAVCRATVHQAVHHQDADHRICVPVHCLARIIYAFHMVTHGKRYFRRSDTTQKSFGKM